MNKNTTAIVVLAVIIIALLAYVAFKPKDSIEIEPVQQNTETQATGTVPVQQDSQTQTNNTNTQTSSWTSSEGLTYNSSWKKSVDMYGGVSFVLPSGSKITYGGRQSSCGANEFGFHYGISTVACLKGVRADIIAKNTTPGVGGDYSAEDVKLFGDFVLKNS